MAVILIYATFPDEKTALQISRQLLEESLIACANLLPPIRSLYWWKGKIEDSGETAVLFKTEAGLYAALETRYVELHPYEVPCLVEIPAGRMPPAYAQWLTDSLNRCV